MTAQQFYSSPPRGNSLRVCPFYCREIRNWSDWLALVLPYSSCRSDVQESFLSRLVECACRWWLSVQRKCFFAIGVYNKNFSFIFGYKNYKYGKLSSSGVWSSIGGYRQGSVCAARWLILAWRKMPNSHSDSLTRQCASLPMISVRFRIYIRESCSVSTVNLVLSKYGRNRSTAHTITMHSLCVVSYRR